MVGTRTSHPSREIRSGTGPVFPRDSKKKNKHLPIFPSPHPLKPLAKSKPKSSENGVVPRPSTVEYVSRILRTVGQRLQVRGFEKRFKGESPFSPDGRPDSRTEGPIEKRFADSERSRRDGPGNVFFLPGSPRGRPFREGCPRKNHIANKDPNNTFSLMSKNKDVEDA
ncbi:hypothetical protein TNCV_3813111 [Trichonephila clavipes]|nr:hypothetical protein TNCV_3813111 [Trichonephila clavipes]